MNPSRLLAGASACCAVMLFALVPGAEAAKKKKAPTTYIYGKCGVGENAKDLCRVDAKTRKTKRIARHKDKKEYDGVSVSASGAAMLLDYGGDMLRTGRDGRNRRELDGFGNLPFLSADGRSAGWIQSYTVPSCTVFPYYSCIQLTYFAAAVQRLGEDKSDLKGSSVFSAGWYRNKLIVPDEPEDDANEDADFICEADNDDGDCTRTIAADLTRAFSSPTTSPDGRYLAVVSEPKPLPNANQKFEGRLEIWNPATGRRVRVLNQGTKDDSPMFSPDGKRVAFQRGDDVLSMSVRGGRAKLIKRNFTLSGPAWAKGR